MKNKYFIIAVVIITAIVVGSAMYLLFYNKKAENKPAQFYPIKADRFSADNVMGKIVNQDKAGEIPDANGDGISDAEAKSLGLNPYMIDNDGDGIFDIDEITITKTDPLKADSDGDGRNDLEELNKFKSDPLKADK